MHVIDNYLQLIYYLIYGVNTYGLTGNLKYDNIIKKKGGNINGCKNQIKKNGS